MVRNREVTIHLNWWFSLQEKNTFIHGHSIHYIGMMRPSKCERVGRVVDTTLMLRLMEMIADNGIHYTGVAQGSRDAKSHRE